MIHASHCTYKSRYLIYHYRCVYVGKWRNKSESESIYPIWHATWNLWWVCLSVCISALIICLLYYIISQTHACKTTFQILTNGTFMYWKRVDGLNWDFEVHSGSQFVGHGSWAWERLMLDQVLQNQYFSLSHTLKFYDVLIWKLLSKTYLSSTS